MPTSYATRIVKAIEWFVFYVSGEFLLVGRANGGTLVFIRSTLVTLAVLVVVFPIKAFCQAHTTLGYSPAQLKVEIGEILPWAGAIFAAAYAAFYARFSSQWNYMASLYNQIMATAATLYNPASPPNPKLATWRAAFIEDAIDLHLARKSMFKSVIIHLLSTDQEVVDEFASGTPDGAEKIKDLAAEWQFTALTPPP